MQRRGYVASPDEIRITRQPDGETALIEYADDTIGGTHLKIGPALRTMTDADVLAVFNKTVAAMDEVRRSYKHVAIELPIGQSQIEWHDDSQQWSPRGHVLRCLIQDGGGDDGSEPLIEIDGKALTWSEFGRLLTTYAGCGMRIVFVPDDETHLKPTIRVGDPEELRRKHREER
jgi:hypothetical protein